MDDQFLLLLEETLVTEDSVNQLRKLLSSMLNSGYDRNQLISELMDYREELEADNRINEEDLILDMLDYLTGWCRSDLKL